jgi:hypothetical protein
VGASSLIWTLNERAVFDFLYLGFVSPGENFFSDSNHSSKYELEFLTTEDKNIEHFIQQIYDTLELAVDRIVSTQDCNSFALSGGVDTRLILHFLAKNHQNFLKNTYIYTRYHPLLGPNNDSDCIVVQRLEKKMNLKINYEPASEWASSYLNVCNEKSYALSGLWGGELLGGQVLNKLLFSFSDFLPLIGKSDLADWIFNNNKNLTDQHVYQNNEFQLHSQLLMQSSVTAFYYSVTWLDPMRALNVSRTPFLDPDFLKKIYTCPRAFLKDYNIYRHIIKNFLGDLATVPFSNPMYSSEDMLNLGKDPKEQIQNLGTPEIFSEEQKALLEKCISKHRQAKHYSYMQSLLKLSK